MSTEVRILERGEEPVLTNCADEVFDDAIDPQAAMEFLADPRHHLAVAIKDGVVVGFASAAHYVHPDKKRPELWINEIGVAPMHRAPGLGKRLLQALLQAARGLGCAEAWVLTDRSNSPAMALYTSVGGEEEASDTVMFTFRVRG